MFNLDLANLLSPLVRFSKENSRLFNPVEFLPKNLEETVLKYTAQGLYMCMQYANIIPNHGNGPPNDLSTHSKRYGEGAEKGKNIKGSRKDLKSQPSD